MEFFHQPNYDWMGKAKYFVSLSVFLLLVGIVAYFYRGGLTYGIDFKGGTLVYVRFVQPPNVDAIRNDLQARGLGRSSIVPIHDVAAPNTNELEIGLEGSAENEAGARRG